MRISDWSSDVCSSDLRRLPEQIGFWMHGFEIAADRGRFIYDRAVVEDQRWHCASRIDRQIGGRELFVRAQVDRHRFDLHPLFREKNPYPARARSEEHTSELQSLMRSSYAVFCLKKKINN